MTEAEMIAAFLAKKGATVCEPGLAYGLDAAADKAKRELSALEAERSLDECERHAESYAEATREAYHVGGIKARDEVVRRWRY